MKTFGSVIAEARKRAGITQRNLAAQIVREKGAIGISPAYLNDIEHDRRTPSGSSIVGSLADALKLDAEYLLILAAGLLPSDLAEKAAKVDQRTYKDALALFRKALDDA